MLLSRFSRDSRLPCKLSKVVVKTKRRKLPFGPEDKIGLRKDVLAIPFNDGFVLCIKDLILHIDNIDLLRKLSKTCLLKELSSKERKDLEQLFYYDLISCEDCNRNLKEVKVSQRYTKRYKKGRFVAFSMVPLAVELIITNTCNFRCIHCSKSSKSGSFPNELSTEEILHIIDECLEIGVPELRFMGGEPLVHPSFFKFIEHARVRGVFQLKLSTNAWLIDENKAKKLAECFDSIQISVHGASSSVHDRIVRKKGAWSQARRATKLLNDNGVKVNIGFSVIRENVQDIYKMPELAQKWKADGLGFLCLIPQGRGEELNGWSIEEILEMGEEIKKIKRDVGSCLNFDVAGFPPVEPLENDHTVYGCEAGKTLMVVDPDGMIKLCGIFERLGTNIKERPLLEIWHSPEFVRVRRQQNCRNCNFGPICWGSCMFLEKESAKYKKKEV